jgi:branched-chain amino acid transport system substrate-binding protein
MLAAVLTLAGCGGDGSGGADSGPITVGVLLPLTGPLSPLGKEMLNGYEVARKMVNDEGGINGRQIEFKVSDAPAPEDAVSVAGELSTDKKVSVILGSYSSSIAIPASAVASRNRKPYWETGSVAAETTNRGLSFLYRTVVSSDLPVYTDSTKTFISDVVEPALGASTGNLRFGLVYEDGPYGTAASDAFKKLAKSEHYNLVASESYAASASDLSSVIEKLKSARVDVLYAVPNITDAILLTRQSAELGFRPRLVLGNGTGFTSTDFVKGVGEAANGIVVSDAAPLHIRDNLLSAGLSPSYSEFIKAYTAQYGREPLTHATLGYSGAMVLFQNVLAKSDPGNAESVVAAAKVVDIPPGGTVAGHGVKFGPTGQNERAGWYFMQYQNKKLVTVYPQTFATSRLVVSG